MSDQQLGFLRLQQSFRMPLIVIDEQTFFSFERLKKYLELALGNSRPPSGNERKRYDSDLKSFRRQWRVCMSDKLKSTKYGLVPNDVGAESQKFIGGSAILDLQNFLIFNASFDPDHAIVQRLSALIKRSLAQAHKPIVKFLSS